MQHGADIELLDSRKNETLLHAIIKAGVRDKKERIQLFLGQRKGRKRGRKRGDGNGVGSHL